MKDDAHRLAALAAGLCQDAGIEIEVRDGGWAWDPIRRVISVSAQDLAQRGADYCAGVITREAGHYHLTRHPLFPLQFRSLTAGRALLDALDAPRVTDWMAQRYPGTRRWTQAVADESRSPRGPAPYFIRFVRECVAEPLRGWTPSTQDIPEGVALALEYTRPARMHYANFVPDVDFDPFAHAHLLFEFQRQVRPALTAPGWIPPRWEQLVQLRALEALRFAEEYILPIAEQLLDADQAAVERFLNASPGALEAAQCQLCDGNVDSLIRDALTADFPAVPVPDWLKDLAKELLEAHLRGTKIRVVRGRPSDRKHPSEYRPTQPPPPLKLAPVRPTHYDRAHRRVADQIHRLARHLGEILRPRRRSRLRAGYPTGRRVDLRKLMQFEADPRRYNELWARTTIPDRRNVAVSLLVDLSGSMDGAKAESAVLGTILMAETLAQLDIPFAINGFQDVLIPLCRFGDGLDSGVRRAIAEIPQEVGGGRRGGNNVPAYNDDGPCLQSAAEELLAYPASERILVVVSDGLPEGRHSDADDLRRVIDRLSGDDVPLELIALGLGPDTGHVSNFYPEAVANVPVERFSDEIGRLVERIVIPT